MDNFIQIEMFQSGIFVLIEELFSLLGELKAPCELS